MISNKSQVVPLVAEHYPLAANPGEMEIGRKGSATVSFIARSMSMVPVPANDDEENDIEISDFDLEDALQPLDQLDSVLIRQIPDDLEKYINVPNRYRIENGSGDVLYDIVETTSGIIRRLFTREQPFTANVLNKQGTLIFELIGDPGVSGRNAFVKVRRKSATLGKVEQATTLFSCCYISPVYNVINKKDEIVSTVSWDKAGLKRCSFLEDFHVFAAKKNIKKEKTRTIANISRQTHGTCLFDYSNEDMYAVTYEQPHMDVMEKVLLISAVILLDFQFFEGRKGFQPAKGLGYFIILLIIIIVLIIALIYFVSKDT